MINKYCRLSLKLIILTPRFDPGFYGSSWWNENILSKRLGRGGKAITDIFPLDELVIIIDCLVLLIPVNS